MPLPSLPGSDDTLMSQPGMSVPRPSAEPGSTEVTPQDQAKGAVEVLSKLRTSNKEQLEAIATQFPAVSKSAKELLSAFDRAVQALVREIVKTTQTQDTSQPRVLR